MAQQQTHEPWLGRALSLLESSEAFVLATVVGPDDHPLTGCHVIVERNAPVQVPFSGVNEGDWSATLTHVFQYRKGRLDHFRTDDSGLSVFLAYCGPPPEAWIFGAGHIACALAPLLNTLGWRVVVCDDRAEFVTADRFPDAAERRAGSFIESARACARHPDSWLVLVTRGHAHDQVILKEFFASQKREPLGRAPYIGMIGSKRRVGNVRAQLLSQGFPSEILDAIHAPIGVPIGADTPAEIALSVAAEMVAYRRGLNWSYAKGTFRREATDTGDSADTAGRLELWRQVVRTTESGRPCVLATIIERRGSTPRGLGAQMAVFGNGTAMGTIGGGCGEGEILRAAREMLLGDSTPRLVSVDLTGDQSSETTDVCGGRYSVFLEILR